MSVTWTFETKTYPTISLNLVFLLFICKCTFVWMSFCKLFSETIGGGGSLHIFSISTLYMQLHVNSVICNVLHVVFACANLCFLMRNEQCGVNLHSVNIQS